MTMDDRPTRDDHSCLFDLDNFYGRIGVGSIFSSPSIIIIIYLDKNTKIGGTRNFFKILLRKR